MIAIRWCPILALGAVGCTAPRTVTDEATTGAHVEATDSTGATENELAETPDPVSVARPPQITLENPQGGTSLARTAHVREHLDGSQGRGRRRSRDGGPRLELVSLETGFFVRAVNDRPRTTWVILHPRGPGNVLRDFIELVAVDADGDEWPTVPSSAGSSGGSSVLRIPPDTTLGLGRARAYKAHAADHASWLRIVYEEAVMVQTPGSRAQVHVRWSGSPPADQSKDEVVRSLRARYREASDIRADDIFFLGAADVSNTVEIIAEPEAGVVHPTEPTAERLPMPEELRETARELGLE